MLKRKRLTALLLTLCLVFTLMPTTAFAEAGNWNPTTPRTEVQGKNVGFQSSQPSSTTLQVGNTGYLRMMPTLSIGNYEYNAMAYCDAKAVSRKDDVVSVDKITTGKWKGGIWDNADCLQVNVTPHKAGTAQVIVSYYYTFSQNPTPFNNPKTRWFNTRATWTIKVTGEPGNFTVTYTDGVEGAEIFADQVYKNLCSGDKTPAFQGDLTREGYDFTGWTPAVQETVSATTVYIATWKEKPATVPEIKNVPLKFVDGPKVVEQRYVTVTNPGDPVVLRAADLAVLLNNKDYELVDKEQSVAVKFTDEEVRVLVKSVKPAPVIKNVPLKFMDGTKVVAERYVTVTDQGEPVVLRAADLAVLLNNEDYELVDKEQPVTVKFDNAEVRVQVKSVKPAPVIKNVPIKFMDGTKVVAERYVTVTDQGEPVVLRAADLAVLLNNEDYELVDKEQPVTVKFDNAEVRVQVKKIPTPEDKTIIVNYVTEDGKNVLTSSIVVSKDATSVNTGLLKDAIYGYEIAVVGDIAIENGAINVTVRERVYTKTVTVNYVTENGENVLTSSIVVSKDATSVNTGLLKDAIYGYEIAVVGDIAIKDGAINVVVREKKQPEEPDNPPHHHGGGSSRSDKITITFMPADGYTLDAQKGTSLRKDGSVSMYISSGIVPEKMIPNAVRADKFYKVTGWAVKDRKGNLEEINLDTYRFKRNTEVYALYDDVWTPYKDMKADRSDWYYKELRDLSISGIVGGYRDGSYHAEAQVTWGAALKLIELAAGNPEQAQIPGTNHACSGYLALAKAKGHVAADAVIDLHRPITRLEFSQVAAKALDLKASHKASPFTDTDDAEVVALNEAGIINGYGNGQFGPKDVIKRSHIAAIIWRINQYQAK